MKTIIIPTDFSPISLNAAHFAADMAMALRANLLLFNAYQMPVTYTADAPVILMPLDELKKGSESQLEELGKKLSYITSNKIKISTESVLGDTVDKLEELCKKIQPFAVVMGTKGQTGLDRVIFGSTTLAAIRHLTWPVIAVPPGKRYGKGIQKIGFACDFTQVEATTPVHAIKEMVKTFGAELHILNVDYKEKHFRPSTPEESFHLHAMFSDIKPQYHYIDHRDVEDGILEFAETNNLDLLIAIPKKHKLLDGIFHPSSTKQLINQSHLPIMCIHE